LSFVLEGFLDPADDDDGANLGDGSEFSDGDDGPIDLLPSSTEAGFLFLAMILNILERQAVKRVRGQTKVESRGQDSDVFSCIVCSPRS
jgi:hypothetical protein